MASYQLPFDGENDPRWRLLEATRARLDAARSQEEIIAIVRACARAVVSADGVTFVLRDGSRCHYVEEDAISPLWKGQKFPMTACISGWAMLHGQTAVIPDVFADKRIPHAVYRQTFVKSMVMTPVGFSTPVAAIGAYWRDKPIISAREVAAVERLAAMVGEALERTRGIAA
jgi:GAF domain-containing protein